MSIHFPIGRRRPAATSRQVRQPGLRFASVSFDCVSPALEARGARLAIGGHACLVLLGGGLLLLLPRCGVLATALATRGDSACGRSRARVAADHFAHDGTARRAPRSRTRRCSLRRGRGSGLFRWVGGVVLAVVHGPDVAFALVLLLLVRFLALGRVNHLLRRHAGRERRGDDQRRNPDDSFNGSHGDPPRMRWLSREGSRAAGPGTYGFGAVTKASSFGPSGTATAPHRKGQRNGPPQVLTGSYG